MEKNIRLKIYNLDAIIAVGYRVNSKKATEFRIWGGFRSLDVAQYFVNSLSIIKTSIKRNRNPYHSIQDYI